MGSANGDKISSFRWGESARDKPLCTASKSKKIGEKPQLACLKCRHLHALHISEHAIYLRRARLNGR